MRAIESFVGTESAVSDKGMDSIFSERDRKRILRFRTRCLLYLFMGTGLARTGEKEYQQGIKRRDGSDSYFS